MAVDISKAHLHWRKSSYNGKEYKSYSLARSFRENGKSHKEILVKLGKLSDKEVDDWKRALSVVKGQNQAPCSLEDVVTEANYDYLDVAVILEIWKSWDLNKVFAHDPTRDVPLWMVAAILTINRCIDPAAKSRISSWYKDTALPYMLKVDPSKINSSRIFRELAAIDDLKIQLCDHLYQEVYRRDPSSMDEVYYDLSTSTFSGTECILMKWGYCKEGYENHIVLALVVNKKGLPIYWEVLPGGTADSNTIDWLIGNLKRRFKITTPTMIFDRGMVSDENLHFLEEGGVKYISAMDRNQLKSLTNFDFGSLKAATPEGIEKELVGSQSFSKLGENAYYREIPLEEGQPRRYILCFNPQLYQDQKRARSEGVARFENFVKRTNRELLEAKGSRARESTLNKFTAEMSIEQRGFLRIKLKEKSIERETEGGEVKKVLTYQAKLEIDEVKLQKAGQLDGFWMLVTNHSEKSPEGAFTREAAEILKAYKDRVVIESSFRDIKSFIEISPIHVWKYEHVKAHYTICVLAHLIDRTLTLMLHEKTGDQSKDVITHNRLCEVLGKCKLNKLSVKSTKAKTVSITQPTTEQKELLKRLDLTHLIKEEVIKSLTTSV